MNKKEKKILCLYAVAVVASLFLAISIALVHPAQWLINNSNKHWLSTADGILFWLSLISLITCQVWGMTATKQARSGYSKQSLKQMQNEKPYFKVFNTIEALVSACVFLVGTILTVIFLIQTRFSTVQTFLSAAFATLGLSSFINFNSRVYRLVRLSCKNKKASKEK